MDGTRFEHTGAFSSAALEGVRREPRFIETARAMAASALQAHREDDAAARWMLKDLGRTSIYGAVAILGQRPEPLTPGALNRSLGRNGITSRGRVAAFLAYAQQAGRLRVEPADDTTSPQRTIRATPAFYDPLRRRFAGALAADPHGASGRVAQTLASDEGVARVCAALAWLTASRPDVFRYTPDPLRTVFMMRDAGMRLLQHFIALQPPCGDRLLERGRLSRQNLSRRYGVSRTHINRLLAAAGEAGLARLEGADLIMFAPALSDALERYYAGQIQVLRTIAGTIAAAPGDVGEAVSKRFNVATRSSALA